MSFDILLAISPSEVILSRIGVVNCGPTDFGLVIASSCEQGIVPFSLISLLYFHLHEDMIKSEKKKFYTAVT